MSNWLDKAKEAAQMAAEAAKKAAETAKNAAQNANFGEMYDKTKAMAMQAADEAKRAAEAVMAPKPPKQDPSAAPSDPESDKVDMSTSVIAPIADVTTKPAPQVSVTSQPQPSATQPNSVAAAQTVNWVEQCNAKIMHIELLLREIKALLAKNT